ncbi:MAG TPA: thioredoxin domain-containing protein [Acidobacteriaceae bacterium]|nr:thioredoxin domain-containing protein [Acidobacteriaceae bacterium]
MSDESLKDEGSLNSLSRAASAYLRSAQHQPIEWNEWGAAAFEKARRENKPVLLDIGAVWCHWCHVMDRESYENPATAEVINKNFVAVKVDRDERPDVDTRYQSAVAAISGQGGWPLTAFLTPDGKPYFGGTYFPPDERYGRPSFQRVLVTMAEAFANRREEVEESAGSVMQAIEHNESFSGRAGNPGEPLLEKMLDSIVKQFDERNGGFGSQPKFPHPGALDLLIDAAGRGGDEAGRAKLVAEVTLEKMAAGGIYDQLAGGFHRYSVDERWVVPHFEKMAYDNSELLKNYAHAFQSFVEPEFARVAKDVLRWMDEWLSDRELGGFYASQDADDSLDDDGDYFTWTRDEAKAVLSAEEFAVAEKYFQLGVVGDMHHNPQKNVLRPSSSGSSGGPLMNDEAVHEWGTRIQTVKEKMYAARLLRKTPYVDKTVYTGWNGMCISAYLAAGRALGLSEPVSFALKSLERVLGSVWSAEAGLAHVVAYGEGVAAARIPGVLEDYAFVAAACLDAWEATGEFAHYAAGKAIADAMLGRFYDAVGGGFFDTEKDAAAIGALSARRKPLQDSPTPAGNAVAAAVLLRLSALTGEAVYETRAQETLETFAGVVEHFGLYAASYGLALRRAVAGPVQVCVIGNDDVAEILAATAMAKYSVNKSVVRLRRGQLDRLPPALAETLPFLPVGEGSVAVVCRGNTCLPPVETAGELLTALNR